MEKAPGLVGEPSVPNSPCLDCLGKPNMDSFGNMEASLNISGVACAPHPHAHTLSTVAIQLERWVVKTQQEVGY